MFRSFPQVTTQVTNYDQLVALCSSTPLASAVEWIQHHGAYNNAIIPDIDTLQQLIADIDRRWNTERQGINPALFHLQDAFEKTMDVELAEDMQSQLSLS